MDSVITKELALKQLSRIQESKGRLAPMQYQLVLDMVNRHFQEGGEKYDTDDAVKLFHPNFDFRDWPTVQKLRGAARQLKLDAKDKLLCYYARAEVKKDEVVIALAPDSFAIQFPESKPEPPNNLPQQLTSFVGRERELADVRTLFGKSRHVTLVGVGGLGKTRLSLHVGTDLLDANPDGAWLVELAPLTDPRLVPQAVASVLGVKEEAGRPVQEALLKFVRDRQLLLILDNCEHLAHACAELAKDLLQSGPQLRVLATSREPLHVAGETTYPLSTLATPDPQKVSTIAGLTQFEAAQLFMDRAIAAHPALCITDRNATTVAEICQRLDGIPLALELAAARVRALSLETIAKRLTDRFHLLTGGDTTAPPRQQTLRACIDWSYDLLTEPERILLRRLAVFAGGWILDAAEAVGAGGEIDVSTVLDLLTYLVEKSLVEFEVDGGRYRLLETVRQYASDRLVESRDGEEVRERHRDYFLALAEEAEPKLLGAEQAEWLQRLENEHDNLRAGLYSSLLAAGSEGGVRFCGALLRFWVTRGHISEGRKWCERVLGRAGSKERTPARAKALNTAGVLAHNQGDYPAARASHGECLEIRQELKDQKGNAITLGDLANVALYEGDLVSARALHEKGLAILRELGERRYIAYSLQNLGLVAYFLGDYAVAWAKYDESLAILQELGDRRGVANVLGNKGLVAHDLRNYSVAWALHHESLGIRRELREKLGILLSLEGLAAVVAAQGRPLHAAQIWGASERLRAEIGLPITPVWRPHHDQRVAAARATLGDDAAFDQAWKEGGLLTLEQAIETALKETSGHHDGYACIRGLAIPLAETDKWSITRT